MTNYGFFAFLMRKRNIFSSSSLLFYKMIYKIKTFQPEKSGEEGVCVLIEEWIL